MKILSATSVLVLGSAHALAVQVSPPFFAQAAQELQSETKLGQGARHLRVILSSDESAAEGRVTLGALTICSKSACYKPETASQVDLQNTASGQGTVVADIDYPGSEVEHLYFESVASNKRVSGDIALATPLTLNPDYHGAEVMIVLSRSLDQGRTTYVPSAVAANLLRDNGNSVFYNPKFATSAHLEFGTTLTVPAGATEEPQIFNVAQHNVGATFPLVDVYPRIDLAVVAKIERHRIARPVVDASTQIKTPTPSMAVLGQAAHPMTTIAGSDAVTAAIRRTGVLQGDEAFASSDFVASTNLSMTPNAYASCAANLSAAVNQQVITNALVTTGTTYLNWCTTVAPYVHIAVTNMLDSRERISLPHILNIGPGTPGSRLNLQPITYWGAHTQVLINGFVWEGDSGTSDGQTGFADGFEFDGSWFADNRVGGGYASVPGTAAGNKIVMGFNDTSKTFQWAETATLANFPISVNHLVSSSTSIMKNGICGSDTLTNSWSAVGTSPSGRVFFVSSTSDGQTSAAELCGIFKALGANYALRLDGGPSAAITIDGNLLNPLTGLASFKYGTMRHIAYPIKISYPGW